MSEAIQTPLPEAVRNHWWWRPGHAVGRHFWACHLILDDQPQLRQLAADYQQALTGLPGIDLIPAQWLHLTMQGIAFTDEVTADELGHLDHALTAALAAVEAPAVEFRALTIQREAVYLKAHPAAALTPLRRAAHDAVLSVLGPARFTETPADVAKFLPHVSIGYITYDGDPQPIAAALSSLTTRTVAVTFIKADLLEFHRDNCMYEWTSAIPIVVGSISRE
jgi:hypothetical protein